MEMPLAQRMTELVQRLNMGEILNINQLAQQYNCSLRTIQRDINERLSFLDMERNGSEIKLAPLQMGNLSQQDLRKFAEIAGIEHLFPTLNSKFIVKLLSNTINSPYMIKGRQFEPPPQQHMQHQQKIVTAISNNQCLDFCYQDKTYTNIQPYKLINHRDIWYLAAVDNGKLKTFHLNKINKLFNQEQSFKPDLNVVTKIATEQGIFFSNKKTTVQVRVSSEVAHYFTRRPLLPHQEHLTTYDNGDLNLSSVISDPLEIVPLVKHWMPHIVVLSPQWIRQNIAQDISAYLAKN